MYRSRLQTEALHDLLEKLQKADFSPTAAFCVSTCCKLTEPEFTSLTSVNIRISSPDGPADRRSEHGGADECCRLHQRFKSSCKIQNWAEKTLHHQQQLVTVVCTLSTLIPIYNGLTTRWCYSGSAVSLTVCGSHVAPPTIRAEMWSIRLTRADAGHTIMCSQRPRRHNTLRTSRVCEMLRKKLVQPAGATAEVNQRLAEMQQIGETVTIWTRKSWRQRVPK